MNPEDLAKSGTEHGHQCALFAWAALSVGIYPELKWMFAIPNGGSRGDTERSAIIVGGKMKAEGVKPGVHDIFLPAARKGCHGLFIEMKKPTGKPSPIQIEFKHDMQDAGYGSCICYTWEQAREVIILYLT